MKKSCMLYGMSKYNSNIALWKFLYIHNFYFPSLFKLNIEKIFYPIYLIKENTITIKFNKSVFLFDRLLYMQIKSKLLRKCFFKKKKINFKLTHKSKYDLKVICRHKIYIWFLVISRSGYWFFVNQNCKEPSYINTIILLAY